MGKINLGILGSFSGKVGNVVGGKCTYSGAYPPINSGRIKSARAAIKSVIPADMHPF